MSILKTYEIFKTERSVNAMIRFPPPVTRQQQKEYKEMWRRFLDDWAKRYSAMMIEEFRER